MKKKNAARTETPRAILTANRFLVLRCLRAAFAALSLLVPPRRLSGRVYFYTIRVSCGNISALICSARPSDAVLRTGQKPTPHTSSPKNQGLRTPFPPPPTWRRPDPHRAIASAGRAHATLAGISNRQDRPGNRRQIHPELQNKRELSPGRWRRNVDIRRIVYA